MKLIKKKLKILKLKNSINIINIDFKFKRTFDKISKNSAKYIENSFKVSLEILKKNKNLGLINGPISKEHFLNKKYLGITEYYLKKQNLNKNQLC